MMSFFKRDPVKKLKKIYMLKLEQAMTAQRNGDIRLYSAITFEAEAIMKEIDEIELKNSQ
jgi:hypothetical protein